ncbi:hypothetical protein AVEN_225706-1 [Araneus ventricosus]|uniref:Fibronectin type-III domain-containing protein n=1 Tax=Araneus ventricosus TaxID=182803 RepID=A0A4Y2FTP4_ARAVE|nr:hypothetical protein AVEN_225706-1 [Araneus ventricosus]
MVSKSTPLNPSGRFAEIDSRRIFQTFSIGLSPGLCGVQSLNTESLLRSCAVDGDIIFYERHGTCGIQQIGGRTWKASDCVITIKIPRHNCTPARYTIAGLQTGIYYEIRLRVRTSAGFGKPYVNKIYTV